MRHVSYDSRHQPMIRLSLGEDHVDTGDITCSRNRWSDHTTWRSGPSVGRWGGHNRHMWFGLLGPMEVVTDGGVVVDLAGRRKLRVLAAVLAGQANRPVPTDVLVEALWGASAPPGADTSLRGHVHRLRGAL